MNGHSVGLQTADRMFYCDYRQLTSPPWYLTIADVAEGLRVSRMTIYRLVQAHALASVCVGRCCRISEQAVEEYVRKASVAAEP